MRLDRNLVEGIFLQRDNRFRATVRIGEQVVKAHVPNSGRLHELLKPYQPVLLAHTPAPHRRTEYDLVMVRLGQILVSMDARLPARLFREAVLAGHLKAFAHYSTIEAEVPFGRSRLDFRLLRNGEQCFVEVKSVTLVVDGCGLFPDAPTTRGQRHIEDLMMARAQGHRAAVVFVIQREDACCFTPYWAADPVFAERLVEAHRAGVEVYAYTCRVTLQSITIDHAVPVMLEKSAGPNWQKK